MGRQFGLAIWKHFKIVNILLIAVAVVLVSENASSHPDDASFVEAALHALEEQGEITEAMHTLFDQLYENGNADKLAQYLESLAKRGEISAAAHIYLQTVLRAGVPEEGSPAAAAPATYSGNGNVTLLGQLNPRAPFTSHSDNSSTGQSYLGIWGYASAGREYALLTHSQGLSITEVTDPANPVEIQFIPSAGGRIQRDIDTYLDPVSGKTYAYFGGQEGANLYSIDLSYLPGTIPASGIVDLGRTNWTHTLQVADGLLFVNSAGSSLGCQIFDAQANPANPPLLAQSWRGSDRDCHDSFTRDNILYSADGYSTRWRIVDIAGIRGGSAPTLLGETAMKSGVYAHSSWLSDDSQYMYSFEEFNIEDINVFDVSDPANPVNVETFQWSGDATGNSLVHNGQVKGDLLHVAYYEAGFRVFDISDPANPVEVGMYETWRDPDGDGTFNKSITGIENGAWNVYTDLPSGYVLVSDTRSGLFVFQIGGERGPTTSAPGAPSNLTATADGRTTINLTWTAPTNTGGADISGYRIEWSADGNAPWTVLVASRPATSYSHTGLTAGTTRHYRVSAINSAGTGASSNVADATTPTAPPPPPPGGGGGGGGARTSVPGAPPNLTAVGRDGEVVLTWDAPESDGGAEITDYEYRINGTNPWISIGSTLTTHTVTGLDNGTAYTFEVRAVNRIGKSFASRRAEAMPEAPEVFTLDFAHFANGNGTTSDLVFVNVGSVPVRPVIYFYDTEGALVSAESVVDVTGDLVIQEDGGLTVLMAMEPLGVLTISTHGRGALVSGSVKVISSVPIGGMLRFDLPGIGEAVVEASPPVSDALFAVRRQEGGITTGVAIHNLEEEPMEVVCELMREGVLRDAVSLPLEANGQTAWLIDQAFPAADTSDFAGSVQCDAGGEGLFSALALEMDPGTRVFLTLPLFPVNRRAGGRAAVLDFAHFANGDGTTSDLVFVNVSTQRSRPAPTPFHSDIPPIRPAIHFYDTEGVLVSAESLVDLAGDLAIQEDGGLTVLTDMEPLGVLTISTHGRGALVTGSVKVVSDGPLGGMLRYNLPHIGEAVVGASPPLGDALFPVRRQQGGITTGVAIHNLESSPGLVRCELLREGVLLDTVSIPLEANGQTSWLIDTAFPNTDTSDFMGSVRCDAVGEDLFSAVALEMDPGTRIFTTLPVFPVPERPDQ